MTDTINYKTNAQIPVDQLLGLLQQTTWAHARTKAQLECMLQHGCVTVSAWKQGQMVGFARALTDHVFRALVDDVVVDSKLRGQGVGHELMNALLAALEEVDLILVRCGEKLVPFYESFEFQPVVGCQNLEINHFERQRSRTTPNP